MKFFEVRGDTTADAPCMYKLHFFLPFMCLSVEVLLSRHLAFFYEIFLVFFFFVFCFFYSLTSCLNTVNRDLRPPNPTKASTHFTIDKNEDTRIGTFLKLCVYRLKVYLFYRLTLTSDPMGSHLHSTQC